MDRLDSQRRSALMAKVKPKNSQIELALRRELWGRGHRYRIHVRELPGTPDIVFTKKKIAVFVDSEFWHGHNWSVREARIGTNRSFWIPKIEATMARDLQVVAKLEALGWRVLRFWGNDIKKRLDWCVAKIESTLQDSKPP